MTSEESLHRVPSFEDTITTSFFFRSWLSGGLANAITSGLLNPLDVAKTRMQIQQTPQSFVSTLRLMYSEAGIWRGLYMPGLSASALREMLSSGPRAGLYTPLRDTVLSITQSPPDSYTVKLSSAMVCGIVGSIIANPIDVIKVRQMASFSTHKLNIVTSAGSILHHEGAGGFLKGLYPSTLRGCCIAAGELGTYDIAKTYLKSACNLSSEEKENPMVHIVASLITGVVAAVVASPFDILKSRAMNSTTPISIHTAATNLLREHGPVVFLRGLVPSYLRLGPHALICFPLLEQLRLGFGLDAI